MRIHHSKVALLGLLLAASVSCSAGNTTPSTFTPSSVAARPASGLGTASVFHPAAAFLDLKSAGRFAILAGSTITSTGPTRVKYGAIGLYPGSAITGFPPGKLLGRFYVADAIAQQAQFDLTRAFNQAMSRTLNPVLLSGNLGGRTLPPGLYKSTSSLAVSSGNLTLDARGHSDAVFAFQIASTFTMTTGRKIILIKGALPRNIFFIVGSSATLGTGCAFKGNLIAHQSISMATGSVIYGRALARIGAVTMQSDTVVRPAL